MFGWCSTVNCTGRYYPDRGSNGYLPDTSPQPSYLWLMLLESPVTWPHAPNIIQSPQLHFCPSVSSAVRNAALKWKRTRDSAELRPYGGWDGSGVALIFLAVRGKLNCANFGHIMLPSPQPHPLISSSLRPYARFMYLSLVDDPWSVSLCYACSKQHT